MKGFKKGKEKTGGREKGVKNKRTEQWEEFADYCMSSGLKKLEIELNKLEGEKFVNAFSMLMEYHKPKLARTEIKAEVEEIGIKTYKIVNAGKGNKD